MNTPQLQQSPDAQSTDSVHYRSALSVADALASLAQPGSSLAGELCEAFRALPWPACYWECPPVTRHTWAQTAFEFMLLDAPYLASRQPDPGPFEEHIGALRGQDAIAVFPSLGKDAVLLAPAQNGAPESYTHILPFVRQAPAAQVQALWEHTAQTAITTINEREKRPTWLSTAGGGVDWLHMRLDSRPKYYKWQAYRRWP